MKKYIAIVSIVSCFITYGEIPVTNLADAQIKKPLIIFARITPKPEYFDTAKQAILAVIPQTIAEPGCRMFTLHEAKNKDDRSLYLYEIWDDAADLENHYNQEYTKAVFAAYQQWLEQPVHVIKLDKIS
jgi:quinol monooxygenase YgiN